MTTLSPDEFELSVKPENLKNKYGIIAWGKKTYNTTDSKNDEFPNVCLYTMLKTNKLTKGHFTSNSKPPACISIVHVHDQKS